MPVPGFGPAAATAAVLTFEATMTCAGAFAPYPRGYGSGSDRGPIRRGRGQAVGWPAASCRPSSATEVSRILNFCTLPVTVIGKPSVNRT